MRRFWQWILGWFRSRPEVLPPAHDLPTASPKEKHWRESFPHNLTVKTKPLMHSGESYRYTRDDKGQIRRKLPKRGK